MWEDFLDAAPIAKDGRQAFLESHEITIVQNTRTKAERLYDSSDDEAADLEPIWCSQCGKMVYGTLSYHNEQVDHMTAIGPRLFLGGVWNAKNATEMLRQNVGTIVSMASELAARPFIETFRYKLFPLEDDPREFIMTALLESTIFLDRHLHDKDGRGILVHCAMGRSRSVAAVVAYLMYSQGLERWEALAFVKNLRPSARPNHGYMIQLDALLPLFRNLNLVCLAIVAQYLPQHGINR